MKQMLRMAYLGKALRRALQILPIGPRGIPPKYTASGSGFRMTGADCDVVTVPSRLVMVAVTFLLGALIGANPAFSSSFVASAMPAAIPFGSASFAPFARA